MAGQLGESMSGFSSEAKISYAWLVIASILVLSTTAFGSQTDWKKDWEQTLAAAKKEGQVTVYIYRYEGLLQDFKREFPGINVVAVTAPGNDLTNPDMTQRADGRQLVATDSGGRNL